MADAGLTKQQSHRWQRLAQIPDSRWEETIRRVKDSEDEELTLSSMLRTAAELLGLSDENEWHTPTKYIAAARAVLGEIDLDPASSAEANETVGASVFYSEADNPFVQEWTGRVRLLFTAGVRFERGLGGALPPLRGKQCDNRFCGLLSSRGVVVGTELERAQVALYHANLSMRGKVARSVCPRLAAPRTVTSGFYAFTPA